MENIRQSIENMNEIYKPLIMPEENNAEDDQLLSVDSTFLQGIPKSPKKLPKLKANLNSGNWQVSFIIEVTIILRHYSFINSNKYATLTIYIANTNIFGTYR